MRISYHFMTTKDLGSSMHGDRFIELLSKHALFIEKCSEYEPINKVYTRELFDEIWKGDDDDEMPSCCFLYKGDHSLKFRGMVTWYRNLAPHSATFNGVSLQITVRRKADIKSLITIGDDLFAWSKASHGYVTGLNNNPGLNLHDGLPALQWVNYFGREYISNPAFHIPDGAVFMSGGIRLQLKEEPNDLALTDAAFVDDIQSKIGASWFGSQSSFIREIKIKGIDMDTGQFEYLDDKSEENKPAIITPEFDKSEIINPDWKRPEN